MKHAFCRSFLLCLVLAVACELRGQAMDPVSAAAYLHLRPPEPIAWGDPVDGLSVGIGAVRAFHGTESVLIISAHLANRGPVDLSFVRRTADMFVIEYDGRFYGLPDIGGGSGVFRPGTTFPAILLRSDPYRETAGPERGVINGGTTAPLEIARGRHSIRIHYRPRTAAQRPVPSAEVTIDLTEDRGDAAAAVAALREIAFRPDSKDGSAEKILAVEGLRNLPGEAAAAGLVTCLHDPNPIVRSRAADALGKMKFPSSIPALGIALSDENTDVQVSAAQALGAIGDRSAIGLLRNRQDDPKGAVRLEVLSALVALGEPVDLPRVSEIIRAKDPNDFQAAIWLVRRNAPDQAVRTLIACLDFTDSSVASYFNHTLVWQIAACGGPKLTYQHDPDGKGSEADVAGNRRTLDAMRAVLSAP